MALMTQHEHNKLYSYNNYIIIVIYNTAKFHLYLLVIILIFNSYLTICFEVIRE